MASCCICKRGRLCGPRNGGTGICIGAFQRMIKSSSSVLFVVSILSGGLFVTRLMSGSGTGFHQMPRRLGSIW